MSQLAIIADDLSSATDCGAQVARSGQSVVVPLRSHRLPARAKAAAVISIDTDSRSVTAEQAYAAVKGAASALAASGWQNFYKSVDSTLRGNLGAEIEAVLDSGRFDCAVIAPAFPKYGRTTSGGTQLLRGTPLNETEFGTDPTAPVHEANLMRLLAHQSRRKAGHIALAPLRQGAAEVAAHLERLLAEGVELVVFDVEEQADLQRVCTTVAASGARVVWVGSTGLAEFVPLALGWNGSHQPQLASQPGTRHPALVIAGSASETTRQQLQHAQAAAGLQLIRLDPGPIVMGGVRAAQEIERVRSALRDALRAGQDAALSVSASREDIRTTQALGAQAGLTPAQVADQIATTLAEVAGLVAAEVDLSGIVATGGDTAKALCEAFQAEALEILSEVEAGIPLMRVLGPRSLPLVTKAGGFGSLAAIVQAVKMVKQYG